MNFLMLQEFNKIVFIYFYRVFMGKIKIMGKKIILNREKLNRPSLMPCNSEPCPASRNSKSMGKDLKLGFFGVLFYVALVEHLGSLCSLSCSSFWPI